MYPNIYKVIISSQRLGITLHKQYNKCQIFRKAFSTDGGIAESKLINTKSNAIDIEHEELTDAIEIERNFFGQSYIKHQPTKLAEVTQEYRSKFAKKPAQQKPKTKQLQQNTSNAAKDLSKRSIEPVVITDKDTGIKFCKLQLGDSRLNNLMIAARSKKRHDKANQIVIEGHRQINEALKCGMRIQAIIFSKREQLLHISDILHATPTIKQIDIFKVVHHDLKLWSILTTTPGILAILQRPQTEDIAEKAANSSTHRLPITVVCDNIREPNNLGSIIRTCAALPCYQIALTKGCCDPWETKALRSGCGGHFRIPIHDGVKWSDMQAHIPKEYLKDCCIFIAENKMPAVLSNDTSIDYTNIANTGSHNLLIIGGETHGVSSEAYQ